MPEHHVPAGCGDSASTRRCSLFSAGLALVTAVLFGLIPALQMAKPEISQVMQSNSGKAAGSVRGKRLHGSLVAAQIALTLLLLTAAGAAIRGLCAADARAAGLRSAQCYRGRHPFAGERLYDVAGAGELLSSNFAQALPRCRRLPPRLSRATGRLPTAVGNRRFELAGKTGRIAGGANCHEQASSMLIISALCAMPLTPGPHLGCSGS